VEQLGRDQPGTAARLGIGQGDVIEIASAHGTVRTAR
jgi:anaerobic selenocysteine-containing dehydrogenase